MMIRTACVVLAASALLPKAASGCSVVGGYRVPTNLELIDRADVVALVEVVSAPSTFADDKPFASGVTVRPLRFLKGTARADELSLVGVTGWNGKPVPTIVTPLGEAHFSVGMGACIRMFYTPGDLLVATYRRTDGRLHQDGSPFSRAVENVSGPDDLWVRIAARYVALTAGSSGRLDARTRVERDAARGQAGVESAALARDLDRYLDREKPDRSGWFTANGPTDTAAMLWPSATSKPVGNVGVYCSRDGRVGPVADVEALSPALRIGPKTFDTAPEPERLDSDDGAVSKTTETAHLFRFRDVQQVLAALMVETGPVGIAGDGKVLAEAPPADALYRLANRCRAWR